jgi:membrane associated rhomboid family serine protease
MASAFVAVEGLLLASDMGLAPRGLRYQAYQAFAFFDIYFEATLSGQRAPAQLWWSFVTHAFLHGGLLHVAMNTAIFMALGSHISHATDTRTMAALFVGTAAAGALAFGVIADTGLNFVPMVGASGAIFGFLGVMKRWEWRYVTTHQLPQRRFWTTVLAFAAINVLLSAGLSGGDGGVAWEAHLGGFAAGWLAGGRLNPRRGFAIGPI